ncbi:type III pantothenate kinase [bacterium]|nr:type III pantothenate kinase [bacterium]
MQLILDIGNTRTKFGQFDARILLAHGILPQENPREKLRELLHNRPPDAILLSRSGQTDDWIEAELTALGQSWKLLGQNLRLPFVNHYATPHTLGTDRMALAAAAVAEFSGTPCLVIDAGTCLTFDWIDAEGHYWGGSIHPGLKMRLEAMHRFTDRLPLESLPEPFVSPDFGSQDAQTAIRGLSTRDGLIIGSVQGMAAEIDGMVGLYRAESPDLKVVLTGGDAPRLDGLLKTPTFARPDFQLHGLNSILLFNSLAPL